MPSWFAPLFAEAEPWIQTVIAFIVGGGLIGSIIKILEVLSKRRDEKNKHEIERREQDRKERLDDEERDAKRTERYIERVLADYDESRKEIHDLRDQLAGAAGRETKQRIKAERRGVWIRSMEAWMASKGIKDFPKWRNGDDEGGNDSDSGEIEMHGPDMGGADAADT